LFLKHSRRKINCLGHVSGNEHLKKLGKKWVRRDLKQKKERKN
jgi:hypothetical protein